jgi:hypothetical protein
MDDALERFKQAVVAFRALDEAFRATGFDALKPKQLRAVAIDLDAALGGLSGVQRGRALVFKANTLYYLTLVRDIPRVYDPTAPPDPDLFEARTCAKEGLAIMEAHSDSTNLPWVKSLLKNMGD